MSRIEAKKHGVKQLQGNDWIVTLVVSNEDFHVWGIAQDGMGAIYTMDVISSEEEAFKAEYSSVISKMENTDNAQSSCTEKSNNSEGDKLRVRAVMLCKDRGFQIFLESLDKEIIVFNENHAREFLLNYCNIASRSSLAINVIAQNLFKNLLERYKDWQFENKYSDNLNRS